MPDTSDVLIVSTATHSLLWQWNNNPNDGDPLFITPWANGQIYDQRGALISIDYVEHVYGQPIPQYQVQLRRYWKLLDSRILGEPVSYDWSVSATAGVSTKVSNTLSYGWAIVLGQTPQLNANLSSTFSTEVEVKSESNETKNIHIPEGIPGKSRYYNSWQLIDEIRVVDMSGDLILPTGYNDRWAVLQLALTRGGERQGGYVLSQTQWILPRKLIQDDVTQFDTPPFPEGIGMVTNG